MSKMSKMLRSAFTPQLFDSPTANLQSPRWLRYDGVIIHFMTRLNRELWSDFQGSHGAGLLLLWESRRAWWELCAGNDSGLPGPMCC